MFEALLQFQASAHISRYIASSLQLLLLKTTPDWLFKQGLQSSR